MSSWASLGALDGARRIHVALQRRCTREARALFNALDTLNTADHGRIEQGWSDVVGELGPAELRAVGRKLATLDGRSADEALVEAAAALIVLDAWHAAHPARLSWHPLRLGAEDRFGADDEVWFLIPPARGPATELARDAGDLGLDLDARLGLRCRVVRALDPKERSVRFLETPAALGALLRPGFGELIVMMGAPAAGLQMSTVSEPARRDLRGRIPYRFVGFQGPSDLEAAIVAVGRLLDAADTAGAHVLMLPELEVPPPLLTWIEAELRRRRSTLGLVVAGSYHVEHEGRVRNRAVVLAGWGDRLWQHDKWVDFVIPAAEAAHLPADTLAALGIDERGGHEDIERGDELVIADLPIGRLAVGICLDFCGGELTPLLIEAGVNLVMVPSMTSSTDAFKAVAESLGSRTNARVWISNSGWLRGELRLVGSCASAMSYRPRRRGWVAGDFSPDVVIWCSNGEVKCWTP